MLVKCSEALNILILLMHMSFELSTKPIQAPQAQDVGFAVPLNQKLFWIFARSLSKLESVPIAIWVCLYILNMDFGWEYERSSLQRKRFLYLLLYLLLHALLVLTNHASHLVSEMPFQIQDGIYKHVRNFMWIVPLAKAAVRVDLPVHLVNITNTATYNTAIIVPPIKIEKNLPHISGSVIQPKAYLSLGKIGHKHTVHNVCKLALLQFSHKKEHS